MIGPMTAPAARMMLPPGPTLRKLRFQMFADTEEILPPRRLTAAAVEFRLAMAIIQDARLVMAIGAVHRAVRLYAL